MCLAGRAAGQADGFSFYFGPLGGVAVVPGGFVAKPSASWGDFNLTRHFFEVDWRMDTGLTLRVGCGGESSRSSAMTPTPRPQLQHLTIVRGR